ncbi:MAG TPA: peptide-methionine (S)-S-oxide reductase MsrA [Polyangiaceae bacterium LLY-WYZ-15_(1-7)]|nr:peptide-methionine (S)-S-oxide reductase [Myxococcales bacterium]MAT23970.1 peptide-methionine (S)-S-oxide reductase [Sandaracinus sp.]HJK91661.1 peptide-methionine (S)-S-oxide reductase MsrA [Polyangiaceae bacterium LLY-WYZ-15_(1-7)]MBJ71628.1 peptide-methionine (S)-S-oxide reductase [Sandaracinus sp.]HJL05597.1 peptide-methionine (S)-S-oxide reductase MsrA [Polyangiaceae bacterium LLY-WYZ-15_(1-7)]
MARPTSLALALLAPTLLAPTLLAVAACGSADPEPASPSASTTPAEPGPRAEEDTPSAPPPEGVHRAPEPGEGQAVAVFAGGCFWCMEKPFEELEGVVSVLSGYAGGDVDAPTYEQVSAGRTGHAEAVRVLYDPSVVSYEALLRVFWHNVDPTDGGGQFCDRGSQYRTAIFPQDDAQRAAAEASKAAIAAELDAPIVTALEEADAFWVAEGYHQDYYRTHPSRYQRYRLGCRRDARLQQLWGESAAH